MSTYATGPVGEFDEALEDHPVEKIQSDLDRLQIPEMLLADPEQELLYTTSGEVRRYDP